MKNLTPSIYARVDYTDAKGEKRPMYLITRDGFTILAMGFTVKAIDFNQMLQYQPLMLWKSSSNPFNIPKTLPEALRLAAQLEERLILEAKIAEDKPYTALGRALTPDQKETSIGQMATILSQSLGCVSQGPLRSA